MGSVAAGGSSRRGELSPGGRSAEMIRKFRSSVSARTCCHGPIAGASVALRSGSGNTQIDLLATVSLTILARWPWSWPGLVVVLAGVARLSWMAEFCCREDAAGHFPAPPSTSSSEYR
jgi:hypothetical protein